MSVSLHKPFRRLFVFAVGAFLLASSWSGPMFGRGQADSLVNEFHDTPTVAEKHEPIFAA